MSRRAVGDPLTPRVLDLGLSDVLGSLASPPLQRLAGSPTEGAADSPTTPWTADVSCTEESAESAFGQHERAHRPSPVALLQSDSASQKQPELPDESHPTEVLDGSPVQATATLHLPPATHREASSVAASEPGGAAPSVPLPRSDRLLAKIFGAVDADVLADVALYGETPRGTTERCLPHDAPPPCISSPLQAAAAATVRVVDAEALVGVALDGLTGMKTAEQCLPHDASHPRISSPLEAAAAAVRSAAAAAVAARSSSLGHRQASQGGSTDARGVPALSKASIAKASIDETHGQAQTAVLAVGSGALASPAVRGEAPVVPVGHLVFSQVRRPRQRTVARMYSTPPPNHYELNRSYNLALSKLVSQPDVS